MYPSTMIAFNVSKQTKLSTCLGIEGFHVIFDEKDKTKVTIKGVISFYNETPQILPIFGADSFVKAA